MGKSPRQCSRILSDEESGDEADRSEEGFGELVVAGGESAVLLEIAEEAFDEIALTIQCEIGLARLAAIGL